MITDTQTRLLTAYVDGELSARQRKAVERLLRQSPDARKLYHLLTEDSVRLRAMPRHHPEPGFSERVVRAAIRKPVPVRRPVRPVQRTIPAWVGLAAAASVLLA